MAHRTALRRRAPALATAAAMAVAPALATAAAMAIALALAACGGGDGDAAERAAVREAVRSALTGTDPRACTEPYTRAFRDQAALGLRALATEYERFCRANVAALAARAVRVSGVEVAGDEARASFAATGGAYPVRSATVRLRRRGGRWLLDRLTALELDRARFARVQAGVARRADERVSDAQAGCVARALARRERGELERALVRARPGVLAEPLLRCAIVPQLRAEGLRAGTARCIAGRLGDDPDALVRALLARSAAGAAALERRFRAAGSACR